MRCKYSQVSTLLLSVAFLVNVPSAAEDTTKPTEPKTTLPQDGVLFNGKDLDGWRVADTIDFEKHGKVEVADGEIILGKGSPATGIVCIRKLPRSNYEVSLDARRLDGADFFCGLTFPVGEEYCTLVVGGWGGGVTGLSNIDNLSAVDNETTDYIEFMQDRWYKVRLRVTDESIRAWIDKKQIVDVARKDRKFSIWWEQEPMRPLGIATWHTKAALRSIRLRSLEGDNTEEP